MGVVGLPYFPDGTRVNIARFSRSSNMKNSYHKNMALEFVKYNTMDKNEFTDETANMNFTSKVL